MITFIVAGGELSKDFLLETLPDLMYDKYIIAADKGVDVCFEAKITPDFIIGDFDSADDRTYQRALESGAPVKRLNPIKDDTDSEAALGIALEKTSEGDIYYLGGTGSRLDHVFGNIALLGKGNLSGRRVILLNETNRIYMLGPNSVHSIKRDEQYGDYVSFFPYMGQVKGLTLKGFKYPLEDATLKGFNTLTVSNEIIEEIGEISFSEGYLIVMETRD